MPIPSPAWRPSAFSAIPWWTSAASRPPGPRLQNNGELKTNETPNLSDVIKSSQGTIQQLNVILAKVDHLADSLNSDQGLDRRVDQQS